MLVDPEIEAVIEAFPMDFSILEDSILPAIREGFANQPGPELSDRVVRVDHEVPGADDDPPVTVRVHTPAGAAKARGCMVWMHGGGLIFGSYEMDDARFDKWCADLDMVAVSVEYRLAPEAPYPAPVRDCYRALSWTHENTTELGIDPGRIGIGGTSAGGGLAAALALMTRDRGEFEIAYQLLIYPMIDDRQQTPSSQWPAPIWPAEANTFGWRAYLGDMKGTEAVPPYAAAARATDLSGLPPTLIAVGGADGFVDENIDYAARLNRSGVETELHVYPGAPHGFEVMAPQANVSQRAVSDIESWLARR